MSLVANARMYAVTPEVRVAWQVLLAWHRGVPVRGENILLPFPQYA